MPDLKPSKYQVLAEGIKKIDINGQKVLNLFFEKTIAPYYVEARHVFEELDNLKDSTASRIGKVIDLQDQKRKLKLLAQVKENFYRQSHVIIERLVKQRTLAITETLEAGIQWYIDRIFEDIKKIPQQLKVAYDPAEFKIQKEDTFGMRVYKLRKRFVKFLTGSPMIHIVHYREIAQHYLVDNRILFMVAYLREFETRSIEDLANHRQLLNIVADSLDILIRKAESDGLENTVLEKELTQLNEQFRLAGKKILDAKELSHNRLLIEYRINLQKMNDTLSRLTVNTRAEKYKKQRKAYSKKLEVLKTGAENWQQNLVWTANKVYAVGKFLFGWISDHIDTRLGFWTCMAFQAAGVALLWLTDSYTGFVVAGAVFGFGMGGVVPLQASMTGEIFGRKNYGKAMGLMSPCMLPVQMLGVPFAGYIYDHTGSYTIALQTFLGIYAVAAVCLAMLRKRDVDQRIKHELGIEQV
jgi:hypothetical protein